MPGDRDSETDRSIEETTFASPLAESEIDGYLAWQFNGVAWRPKALTLRETAAVVRYLLCLALHGVPKKIVAGGPEAVKKYWVARYLSGERISEANDARQCVQRTAEIIWGDLLQFGQFEAGSKREARGQVIASASRRLETRNQILLEVKVIEHNVRRRIIVLE